MATSPRGGKAAPAKPLPVVASRIHGGVIAANLTKPGTSHRRQKRMGPAPFASFEDLSDELESPEDKNAPAVVRLPGIREDATPCSPAPGEIRAEFIYTGISLIGAPSTPTVAGRTPTASTPAIAFGEQPTKTVTISTPAPTTTTTTTTTLTPRIDISRASSSSHHDSKESTPEKEEEVVKLGLEEGAVELRASTEEMEFAGAAADASKPQITKTPPAPAPPPPPQAHAVAPHDQQQLHEDSYHSHNRKDSQSSELGLLCISGRTSRLSSIGSAGSAHSRVSNASHLSVVSGASRSPSPHKMLLETSFCGTKPKRGALSIDLFEGGGGIGDDDGGKNGDEGTKALEKALLLRQHDPTKALIAEGVDITPQSPLPPPEVPVFVRETKVMVAEPPKSKPKPKALSKPLDKVTIKIDKPPTTSLEDASDDVQRPKLPKHIVSASGIEYIYIPLKGPLPDEPPGYKEANAASNGVHAKTKVRETKSAGGGVKECARGEREKRKSKSASPSPAMTRHYQSAAAGPSTGHRASADEPKYIRIRLKPDSMYEDFDPNAPPRSDVQKPETLNLQSEFDEITVSPSHCQSQTPKSRYLTKESPKHKSPSPSLSRKSSFASLFKSRETISPESPTPGAGRKQRAKDTGSSSTSHRRSRSKSRERGGGPSSTESIDSKGKGMFSLFAKPRKASSRQSLDRSPGPDLPNLENLAQNIQNTSKSKRGGGHCYESPLQGESVRIPLHSPTYYENKSFLEGFKTSSQDSQETVIEVKTASSTRREDKPDEQAISTSATCATIRQSSTSSENIVFSTKLGSNNEIFSTKLPKHQEIIETTTAIVEYVKERVTSDEEGLLGRPKIKSCTPPAESIAMPTDANDVKERRISTSTSSESRKFKLEKSKRVSESNEQLATITLTQSTTSSSYIPKSTSREPVESKSPVPQEKEKAPSPREKPMLQAQSSDDIPIIAKEKLKLKELKKSEEHYSSESEREFDAAKAVAPEETMQEMEPERKGLVLQQDSFEDELPYIPTTLPQERSMAVPIIPVKQRASIDVRTCPIDRPRSTTPIKPTLEVYRDAGPRHAKAEKLKISLPKGDEPAAPKLKSPRRRISDDSGAFSAPAVGGKADWFDFSKHQPSPHEDQPPPLPPKGMQKEWINFEEIPEKRKAPKRIQTIPSRGNIEVPETLVQAQENVIYTYVNPEDCKCECHERPLRPAPPPKLPQPPPPAPPPTTTTTVGPQDEEDDDMREDEMPLLDDDDEGERERPTDRLKPERRSVISDSSMEFSTASQSPGGGGGGGGYTAHEETANGTARTGTATIITGGGGALQTPFTADLGMSSNSNRSSIISQDEQT